MILFGLFSCFCFITFTSFFWRFLLYLFQDFFFTFRRSFLVSDTLKLWDFFLIIFVFIFSILKLLIFLLAHLHQLFDHLDQMFHLTFEKSFRIWEWWWRHHLWWLHWYFDRVFEELIHIGINRLTFWNLGLIRWRELKFQLDFWRVHCLLCKFYL